VAVGHSFAAAYDENRLIFEDETEVGDAGCVLCVSLLERLLIEVEDNAGSTVEQYDHVLPDNCLQHALRLRQRSTQHAARLGRRVERLNAVKVDVDVRFRFATASTEQVCESFVADAGSTFGRVG